MVLAHMLRAAGPVLFAESAAAPPITVRGIPTSATAASGSTLTIAKPTGVIAGDVLIAQVALLNTTSGGVLTLPSGWILIDGNGQNLFYNNAFAYLVAGASEPASYSFSTSVTIQNAAGVILALANVNPSVPIDQQTHLQQTSTVTHTTTAITPTNANSALVAAFVGAPSSGSFTLQSPIISDAVSQSGTVSVALGHIIQTVPVSQSATATTSALCTSQNNAASINHA